MSGRAILYGGRGGVAYFEGGSRSDDGDLKTEFRNYISSSSSKLKRELVKKIATALKILHIDVNTEGTTEEIAASVENAVSKIKLKDSFNKDKSGQEQFCMSVAKAFNDIFTPSAARPSQALIDITLPPVAVCTQIAEFLHELARGLPVELFEVQPDIKNVLRRTELLTDVLAKLQTRVDSIFSTMVGNDDKLSPQAREYEELSKVVERVTRELKAQHIHMASILKVALPDSNDDLVKAFTKGSDMKNMIEELTGASMKLGTTKFAQSLRDLLSGMSTVAHIANEVEQALSKLGITVDAYTKNIDSISKLKDTIRDKALMKDADIKAVDQAGLILTRHFNEKEVKDYLSGSSRSTAVRGGVEDWEINESDVIDDNGFRRLKTSVEKQVEKAKYERRALVKMFVDALSEKYGALYSAVEKITEKLGKTIKLTHRTDIIRDYIKNLAIVNNSGERAELYLMGMSVDGESRMKREQYITTFQSLQRVCADDSEFKELSSYIQELLDMIEKFYERTQLLVHSKYDKSKVKTYDRSAAGHGDEDKPDVLTDSYILPSSPKTNGSLIKSINDFVYKYYAVDVKHAMKHNASMYKKNTDDYQKLLGISVSNKLEILKDTCSIDIKLKDLEESISSAADSASIKLYTNNIATINEQLENKIKFYEMIQAGELYLHNFVETSISNIEIVKELKKELDNTDFIANWFNKTTSKHLAAIFEKDIKENSYEEDLFVRGFKKLCTKHQSLSAVNTYTIQENNLIKNAIDFTSMVQIKAFIAENLVLYNKLISESELVKAVEIKLNGTNDTPTDVSVVFTNFMAIKNIINLFSKINANKNVFMNYSNFYQSIINFLKHITYEHESFSKMSVRKLTSTLSDYEYFTNDDINLFADMIKAIVAQIIVVVSAYNMITDITPISTNNITRVAIGGGNIVPNPDASELYFRLPKLAKYYKKYFNSENMDSDIKIAFIPEVNGIFSSFISLLFIQHTGDIFNEIEMQDIINEINIIYDYYKNKSVENICDKILDDFMDEINYRIGVVKKSDANKYWETINSIKNYTYSNKEQTHNIDFKILPNENDEFTNSTGAPSSRYINKTGSNKKSFDLKTYENDYKTIIKKTYESVLNDMHDNKTIGLSRIIEQYQSEMNMAKSVSEKCNIAYKLIQSSDTDVDVNYYIIFEETVIVGIDNINKLKNVLDLFKDTIAAIDLPKYCSNDAIDDKFNFIKATNAFTHADISQFNAKNATAANTDNIKIFAGNVNMTKILSTIIKLIVNISGSNTDLITFKFIDTDKFSLDFSKMYDTIIYLLEEVRMYIDKLKKYLPINFIKHYEGIVYKFESTIIDTYFRQNKIDELVSKLQQIYTFALNYHTINMDSTLTKYTYTNVFKELVYYDKHALAFINLCSKDVTDGANNIYKLCRSVIVEKDNKPSADSIATLRADGTAGTTAKTNVARICNNVYVYNSLMFTFNKLYFELLNTCKDPSNDTIYANIINNFVNGPASSAITSPSGKSWPDVVSEDYKYDKETGNLNTEVNSMLLQSLAMITNVLTTEKVLPAKTVNKYLILSLTEVPSYMKEKLKCFLPLFIKKFTILQEQCNLIKLFITKTTLEASSADVTIDPTATHGMTPGASNVFKATGIVRTNFVTYIDMILGYISILTTSMNDVIKELIDVPVFMQISNDSLEKYKLTNKTPLILLSMLEYYNPFEDSDINDNYYEYDNIKAIIKTPGEADAFNKLVKHKYVLNDSRFSTAHSYGSNSFKLLYGIRGIILSKNDNNFTDSIKNTISECNNSFTENDKINVDRYLEFCKHISEIFVYNLNNKYFKTLSVPKPIAQSKTETYTYMSGKTFAGDYTIVDESEIINILTNEDQKSSKLSIVKQIPENVSSNQKEDYIIANIVDMNKIPFNINSLSKDIPFANIYTYSLTFEKYMNELFPGDDNSGKGYFRELCINPYKKITGVDIKYGNFHRMALGKDNIGMGRPKFISDQIYNSLLLSSRADALYDDDAENYISQKDYQNIYIVINTTLECGVSDILNTTDEDFNASYGFNKEALFTKLYSDDYNVVAANVILDDLNDTNKLMLATDNTTFGKIQTNCKNKLGACEGYIKNNPFDKEKVNKFCIALYNVLTSKYKLYNMLDNYSLVMKIITRPNFFYCTTEKNILDTFIAKLRENIEKTLKSNNNISFVFEKKLITFKVNATDIIISDRLNSMLVLNLIFFTNLQRVIRAVINRNVQSRDEITTGHSAMVINTTEYGFDPLDINEVYDSKINNKLAKFNSQDNPDAFRL